MKAQSIDPELKYCPQCKDEYRAEISHCATCTQPLVLGHKVLEQQALEAARKTAQRRPLRPGEPLVSITSGAVLQIQQLQNILKKEGIPSLAASEDSRCGQGCCGANLVLQVRVTDLEEVQALLHQEHLRSTGLSSEALAPLAKVFDTDVPTATCPACGCTFSTLQSVCPDCGLCFT
jgi:hypothetical protein